MSNLLPGLEGYAKRDVSLGQWDTHPEVAAAFARWCGEAANVLEPCAGIGNLVRALEARGAVVNAIEIDLDRAKVCRALCADFLATKPAYDEPTSFDLVAMNPPYENDGESRFIEHGLRFAPRVCAIVRMVALASERRASFWRSVLLTRLAVLVPRPVFAGSSGMDEIVFVEVERDVLGAGFVNTAIEWLDWRPEAQRGKTP